MAEPWVSPHEENETPGCGHPGVSLGLLLADIAAMLRTLDPAARSSL